MGIAMFPDGDPAVANGKPSAELSGIVNGVEHHRSRSGEGRYRPVGAAFAIELTFLNGRSKLAGVDVYSLMQYDK